MDNLPLSSRERGPGGEVIFIFIFLSSFIIYPSSLLAQLISPYAHLTITSFNDNWGGGLTHINDDKRSFGFDADFQQVLYGKRVAQITLSWSGLTDRYNYEPTRLDEINLNVRLPIASFAKWWHVDAITGLYSYGDFGGEKFQNRVHESAGVPPIAIPYADFESILLKIGGQLWGDMRLKDHGNGTSSRFILVGRYIESIGTFRDFDFQMAYAVRNEVGDQVQLTAGYNLKNGYVNEVLGETRYSEYGLFFNYGMRLGLFNYGLTVYPLNHFSSGYMGISLFNWRNRKPLEKVDATAEFGAFSDANGFYIRYLQNNWWNGSEKFQLDFHFQFWTIANSKLPEWPEYSGHYRQISAGGSYTFITPKPKFQVLPYISLRMGSKHEYIYERDWRETLLTVWSLNAIGEAGLRLKLPANIIHKNCYYGLTANYQYVATFFRSNDYSEVYSYPFGQNLGYFGLGGFVMIDF